MALEQLRIHEIVKQAVGKQVDIPEFQRDFVWGTEQVKLLIESLYRDYPIGSFLLWDSIEYQETKTGAGSQASLWIVDGQQRTTALCLLMGMKPYWWPTSDTWNEALQRYDVMVNLFPDADGDNLEFALPNPIRSRDPRWVSVRRILSMSEVEGLTPIAQEIANQITKSPDRLIPLFGQVHARLQRLWQVRERYVPIVKINHEVEDVAEIFARLNREGTRVKEADVTLALAAVRNPGWVREQYLPYCENLEERGWDLDAGIFIRAMTAIGHGRARLIEVPKAFWGPNSLPQMWTQASDTLSEVLKRLAEFGVLSPDLLPSTNSLIPLVALHHRWGQAPDYRFPRAFYWFLLANKDGRYSGSAITSLNEDVRAIADSSSFPIAVDSLLERLRVSTDIGDSEFLNRYDRAGNRFLRLMIYLTLFRENAQDWVDRTRIGYDKTGGPITSGFSPHWHHIFPKSFLRKSNIQIDEVNALANVTVMNEKTNVNRLSAKPPAQYLQQYNISGSVLKPHAIPDRFAETAGNPDTLKQLWSIEHYTDFLLERAQLLARLTTRYLQNLNAS